jgi:hypothetical protein
MSQAVDGNIGAAAAAAAAAVAAAAASTTTTALLCGHMHTMISGSDSAATLKAPTPRIFQRVPECLPRRSASFFFVSLTAQKSHPEFALQKVTATITCRKFFWRQVLSTTRHLFGAELSSLHPPIKSQNRSHVV